MLYFVTSLCFYHLSSMLLYKLQNVIHGNLNVYSKDISSLNWRLHDWHPELSDTIKQCRQHFVFVSFSFITDLSF